MAKMWLRVLLFLLLFCGVRMSATDAVQIARSYPTARDFRADDPQRLTGHNRESDFRAIESIEATFSICPFLFLQNSIKP